MMRGPRLAGLLVGLALAAGLVISARPAAGPAAGPDLDVTASHSGEVAVEPAGRVLSARALRPGGAASGRLVLHNQTAFRLALRPQVDGATDLDPDLRIIGTSAGTKIHDGTLGALRARRSLLKLPAGGSATLAVRASLPAGTPADEVAGLSEQLSVAFQGERAR